MILQSFFAWFGMMMLAIINGGVSEAALLRGGFGNQHFRDLDRLLRASLSPLIKASFLARVHLFSCCSRLCAADRSGCSSEHTIASQPNIFVVLVPDFTPCSVARRSRSLVMPI
jgi:hypothetical protein